MTASNVSTEISVSMVVLILAHCQNISLLISVELFGLPY